MNSEIGQMDQAIRTLIEAETETEFSVTEDRFETVKANSQAKNKLIAIGEPAIKPVKDALIRVLSTRSEHCLGTKCGFFESVLGEIGMKSKEATDTIASEFQDFALSQNPHHREVAAKVFNLIENPNSLPALRSLVTDDLEEIREVPTEALVKVGRVDDLSLVMRAWPSESLCHLGSPIFRLIKRLRGSELDLAYTIIDDESLGVLEDRQLDKLERALETRRTEVSSTSSTFEGNRPDRTRFGSHGSRALHKGNAQQPRTRRLFSK